MSEEHERKQSLKNREFQFSPFSDSVRIPLQLLAFAKKEGYSIYKPGLQRDRESSEEKTQDEDGTIHIVTRTKIGPAYLKEYEGVPRISEKWEEYKGRFLLQSSDRAYILALDKQLIGRSHPLDDDIPLHFVCIASIPPLTLGLNEDQEEKWRSNMWNRTPKPSYERFRLAEIENKAEGMLIEIHEGRKSFVTINTEDELLQDFLRVLTEDYGMQIAH